MTGLHLSHYAIEAEIGRGGMGIVFQAKDTKLNRTVALKVLPAGALASEDDRARFLREAQASAQLNHPNVCHVYQVDEAQPLTPDGKPVEGQTESRLFIAMEYIDGETLHDYVKKGPLKLQEAVNIARHVAEALKAAHAKDIVHRDIKGANVMLTPEGVAKVLDFGLAKTNASTMLTRMGSTLGTIAYMSPEQARGEEVDGRSDLYSLGTVLYEMVSGKLPFAGDYEQAVVYQILNESPEPLTAVRTGVPLGLERIVDKLLSKEPRHRYQTAADLVADLETVDLSGSTTSRRSLAATTRTSTPVRTKNIDRWGWAAMALLFGVAATWSWLNWTSPTTQREPIHLSINLPDASDPLMSAWMPDGRAFYYVAIDTALNATWINRYDLATGQASSVAGSDGASVPHVSPDGEWLVFFVGGQVRRAPTTGGVPTVLPGVQTPFPSAHVDLNGDVIFTSGRGALLRWRESGGVDTLADNRGTGQLFVSPYRPPGSEVYYWIGVTGPADGVTYRQTLDMAAPEIVDNRRGVRGVFDNGVAILSAQGGLVSNGPWGVALFDADKSDLVSPPIPSMASRLLSFSPSGHILYVPAEEDAPFLGLEQIYRVSDGGPEVSLGSAGLITVDIAAAHRSNRVAIMSRSAHLDPNDIVVFDPDNGTETSLTREGANGDPFWGPRDEYVYFDRRMDGSVRTIARRRADGSGDLEVIVADSLDSANPTVSPDGSLIVYSSRRGGETAWDLYGYRTTTGQSFPIVVEARNQGDATFSPDGRYLAYRSNGSPTTVLVVAPDGSGMVEIATNAGFPAWSPDGRSLYFRKDSNEIHRVPVTTDPVFRTTGAAEMVYDAPTAEHIHFDVAADGSLVVKRPGPLGASSETGMDVRLVLNFDVMAERLINR